MYLSKNKKREYMIYKGKKIRLSVICNNLCQKDGKMHLRYSVKVSISQRFYFQQSRLPIIKITEQTFLREILENKLA